MSVFVKGLRTGAGWIVLAVLAATAGPGRAQIATPTDSGRPVTAQADDSEPRKVSPRDFSSPPDYRVMADLTGVDVTAARTLASLPKAVAETPRTDTRVDFKPADASAPAPPATPPAPPVAAQPTETPGAPTNPTTPEPGAAASSEIAGALDGALASLVALSPTVNPLGGGDWRAARAAMYDFYTDRLFAPVWVDGQGLTPRGRAVLARLARADEDGLDLAAFTLPDPTFADTRPERLAQVETTISAALVAYALQASGSRIAPAKLSNFVTASPAVVDPAKALSETASAAEPGDALTAYNPGQKGYQDLRDELARLRATSSVTAHRPLAGPTLRIGMADSRVPLIRARFGLGARVDPSSARLYDARVASAVAAFQKSNGLAGDGALTTATSEALFGSPNSRREAAILANMEMWRWQPREVGQARIEINVPDYTLHVMNGDDEVLRARVIVGKPDTPTPIFSNEVKYILLNPIWRVPDSIIKKEMLPKLASDPRYLARRGFQVSYVGGRLVVNQPPGEGNALGRILFMFPNEHSVYLHDTPTRALFWTARRAYSHGCVRVEEPLRLAELLMGGQARGWSAGRIQALLGTNEKAIFLPHPLPIHIEYFTEFIDAAGAAQEREDVYGLTAQVAATLSRLRQY
jgi:L,D-transpeptidase YcbB